MNPQEAFECMKVAALARIPFFLEGDPGDGKSALARQLAHYFHIPTHRFFDERATLKDPTDIRGFPRIEGDRTQWCLPQWLPDDNGEPAMILVDEITTAVKLTQASYYQIMYDYTVDHTYKLPSNTILGMAGNPVGIGATASQLPSPLASRVMWLKLESHVPSFLNWANGFVFNQKAPEPFQPMELKPFTDESKAFIRFKGSDALNNFDPEAYIRGGQTSYACPRTHELADRALQVCDLISAPKEIMFNCLAGLVGQDIASQRLAFRKLAKNLPDPIMILADPDTAPLPTDYSVIVALTTSLVDHMTEFNVDNFMRYANRLPSEYQAKLIKEAERHEDKARLLHNARGYTIWVAANA